MELDPQTLLSRLPDGPRELIECVINKGGTLYGSTVRKLLREENDFTDFDLLLGNRAAPGCVPKTAKLVGRSMFDIGGFTYHLLYDIPSCSMPLFDVNMLAISSQGLTIRPLASSEQQFRYSVGDILAHIEAGIFTTYPGAWVRKNYQAKLVGLLATGWIAQE
jgi:hypothetical protein